MNVINWNTTILNHPILLKQRPHILVYDCITLDNAMSKALNICKLTTTHNSTIKSSYPSGTDAYRLYVI